MIVDNYQDCKLHAYANVTSARTLECEQCRQACPATYKKPRGYIVTSERP